MNRKNYIFKGVLPLILAAVSWGVSYFIRKYITHEIGAFTIILMYSIAAATFLYVIGPSRYTGFFARFSKNWKLLIVMSVLSATVGMSLLNTGLKYMDLGVACLLERTQVIFTVIIAAIFLGEKLTNLSILLGLVGIVAGFFVMPMNSASFTFNNNWQTPLGAICVISAAFVWAFTTVMSRKLAKDNLRALDMSMTRAIVGAVTALPLAFIFEATHHIDSSAFLTALALAGVAGIIAGGIGYSAYYYGLKQLSAGVSGMMETFTPLTGVLLGIVFLHEQMSGTQWIAAVILLVSLAGLIWVESRQNHEIGVEPQG